jgi:hypothetical protein
MTALERYGAREVFAVRFLGGIVALPPTLVIAVVGTIWVARGGDWTAAKAVGVTLLVLLCAFLIVGAAAGWQAVRVTIEPDRLVAHEPLGVTLCNAVSWKRFTRINLDESIAPEPKRTGFNRYGVCLSSSEKVFVDGFTTGRSASAVADVLGASLERVRAHTDSGEPGR